jgi:Domain of unknown function (DUF4157)
MRTRTHRESGASAGGARAARPAPAAAQPAGQAAGIREQGRETQGPLPHGAAMERAFGLPFAGVSARTGAGAALDPLSADAATRGSHLLFRDAAPSPSQVAHELTHVLQQRQPSGERGVSAPGSAAEREASRNALRVGLGLAPKPPQERASPEAVYRDIKSDLRKAMEGWGTDEDSIYARLGKATDDEKAAVREDPALMAELQDELTRGEWVQALNLLGQGVETQIREAGAGWGTDEEGIYRAVESATAPAVKEMLGNGALLLYLRDELTDGELGRVLGSAADTMSKDAATKPEEVFHILMLFPNAADKACDRFDTIGGGTAVITNVITKLPLGALMTPGIIADADTHIDNDGNKNRIFATLMQRWDFNAGKAVETPAGSGKIVTTPGAADWTVDLIRKVNRALKMVPPEHVTQTVADIKFVGVDPKLETGAGVWWGGSNVIQLNEDSAGIDDVVRHEVGHSIDDLLEAEAGKLSRAWKTGAPNLWDWGYSLKVWENRMTDPWKQDDGTPVVDPDQAAIRTAIETYATTTECSQDLRSFVKGLSPKHPMLTYWGKGVPVIEAARSLAGIGKTIWNSKGNMRKDANGSRFTWKPKRAAAFLVFDDFVWQNVRNPYALSNHPEFFAVLYEEYYSKGTGDERKTALNQPNWQNFFDNTVHGAR